ncbi:MAG: hypothetical protein EAZ60_16265 [Oscillatoriales cyanobacterium]|nr:MAG: hypothetical protein EAZ60_16265 [Oscillatoriales cyanobacterium]
MQTPVNLIPSALGELFAEVNQRGYITLADRYGLLAAIFDETLTEDDKRSIDRLLRSVCRVQQPLITLINLAFLKQEKHQPRRDLNSLAL